MARKHGPSIKNPKVYEALRDQGASKEKAARIANAQADDSRSPSKKGGEQPPYEQWTKKELYDRAKDLDIHGRSAMDKDELIQALRDR
ncbi:MAG: Rho termination factor [Rhizobiales bacterium]|nr:Rho termination factor [Hyphomicrobiales bacterium]